MTIICLQLAAITDAYDRTALPYFRQFGGFVCQTAPRCHINLFRYDHLIAAIIPSDDYGLETALGIAHNRPRVGTQ